MSIAQTLALNWRAITAFLMAGVQLATALGLLPVGSESTANTLIATAGGVIAVIAGGSYVQNIATSNAITRQAGALEQQSRTVEAVAVAEPSRTVAGAAAMLRETAGGLRSLAGEPPR